MSRIMGALEQCAGTAVFSQGLPDAVLEWDLPVLPPALVAIDGDGHDDELCPWQQVAPVGRRLDRHPCVPLTVQSFDQADHHVQALLIDIA